MRPGPARGPEHRLRRTLELRGRPLKLNVGRLLKEFQHQAADSGVGEAIESRLAEVGVQVRPNLHDLTADMMVTLELTEPELPAAPDADGPPAVPEAGGPAAEGSALQPPADAPEPPTARSQGATPVTDGSAEEPATPPAEPAQPADEAAQSLFVRAAVEAERHVRDRHDRARDAAAERIAVLERELAAELEATQRARDERDQLERLLHAERRETAARVQALASAERTARSLLEAQRSKLTNLTHTVRVSAAVSTQARETFAQVHGQVEQTASEIRATLDAQADGVIATEPELMPDARPEDGDR